MDAGDVSKVSAPKTSFLVIVSGHETCLGRSPPDFGPTRSAQPSESLVKRV